MIIFIDKNMFSCLHNQYQKEDVISMDFYENIEFIKTIKPNKTKRITPYSETEFWKKELLSTIKYEKYANNKAALALLWYLDVRPHKITILKTRMIFIF